MPAGPAVTGPANAAPAGTHPGPWKLKTNFGLTYEFPDTRGLRSWLASREELDGYTVSADDGGSFHELGAFPQLDRNAGRTPSMSGNMSMPGPYGSGQFQNPTGSGQYPDPTGPADRGAAASQSGLHAHGSGLHTAPNANPTTGIKGPRVNTEYRPPSREGKSKALLWAVFLLLAVVAVVIALESFGVFSLGDIGRDLGILSPAPTTTVTPVKPIDNGVEVVPEVDNALLAKQQAAEVERLLTDAERLVEGNKLPAAMDMLKTTEQLAPTNPIVYDLKARVFTKLGKKEQAEEARTKAAELRDNGTAPEEPGGEDPEDGADPDPTE